MQVWQINFYILYYVICQVLEIINCTVVNKHICVNLNISQVFCFIYCVSNHGGVGIHNALAFA